MSAFDKLPPLGAGPLDENGIPTGFRMRERGNLIEDARNLVRGVLDPRSFAAGYKRTTGNPVEVRVYEGKRIQKLGATLVDDKIVDELGNVDRAHWEYKGERVDFRHPRWQGALSQVRRARNLRTTSGRDSWQRLLMFGNISANSSFATAAGSATATSATTLTNSGAAFPTTGGPNTGLQGQIVVCSVAGVYGVILSNTATVLTVQAWTSITSATGAAGSTPASTAAYVVLPIAGPANWVGLSTNSAAAAAGDVLRTSDGLFGDGSTGGASTEQTANGLARAYLQPTFPSAGNIALQATFTYTASSSVTINKVILANSAASGGSILVLETLLNAAATVAANGDAISLNTWAISL